MTPPGQDRLRRNVFLALAGCAPHVLKELRDEVGGAAAELLADTDNAYLDLLTATELKPIRDAATSWTVKWHLQDKRGRCAALALECLAAWHQHPEAAAVLGIPEASYAKPVDPFIPGVEFPDPTEYEGEELRREGDRRLAAGKERLDQVVDALVAANEALATIKLTNFKKEEERHPFAKTRNADTVPPHHFIWYVRHQVLEMTDKEVESAEDDPVVIATIKGSMEAAI